MSDDPLQASSERVVPGNEQRSRVDAASYAFHRASYEWAAGMTSGRRVVDYGCGTGYGSAVLADTAEAVLGVDTFSPAIEFARQHFPKENLTFETIDGSLPVPDGSQSVVVSFQVIEHVDPDPYLHEAVRVLSDDGFALFATPNRLMRLYGWQQPWNRWHVTEYDPEGFRSLLLRHFDRVELFGLSASGDLADILLSRWRRTRLLTVPLTLPFTPNAFRSTGLHWLSRLGRRAAKPDFDEPRGEIAVVPVQEAQCEILAIARQGAA